MASKKQWIHLAQKSWEDAKDSEQKNRLAWLIKKNHIHHFPLFDQTIFINNTDFAWTKEHPTGFNSKEELLRQWSVFMPDMFWATKNLILEIDGKFHFNTEKGVKQTKKRNQYYEYAGIKLVTMIPEEMDSMTDMALLQDLKSKL